jgi:hypothetical protein
MAPVIRNVVPPSGKAGTPIAASGLFFSSTRPTVYLQNPATKKRTACRVTNGDMNPATGASTLAFLVPELNPGSYDLVLKNAIGEALSSFSVSSR